MLTDYARDAGPAWMIAFPYQVRTFALTCDEVRKPGRVINADEIIGATRDSYDGKAPGVAPTEGLVTATQSMEGWQDNQPVYFTAGMSTFDDYGRVRFSYDAEQKKTETSYTPAIGGPLVQVSVLNPLGWTASTQIDPGTGATTLATDANGRATTSLYDGLGRLISVWKPGRRVAKDIPDVHYTYSLNTNRASVVQTDTLNASGKATTSYTLYDSLLRPVQTQVPSATKGMLVTDTFYDTAGRANVNYGPYWVDSTVASATRWQPPMPAGRDNILSWTKTVFDGVGRPTDSILFSKLAEKWRTTTVYGGDHVDAIPPLGGTVESKYVDPLGRTTQIRQYHGRETTGDYDSTTYTYNGKGQLATVTNPMQTVWRYGYDIQGRQSSAQDPDKGTVVSRFDRLGRLLTTTDSRHQTLAYSYDDLGRKIGLFKNSTSGTKLAAWTYDAIAGSLGMLTSSDRYVDGDLANPYTTATLTLDAAGRPTKTAITVPPTEPGLAGTYTYQARYAADGTPATSIVPAVGGLPAETMNLGFSALGMPTTLSTTIGDSYVPSVQFTEFGEPSITVFASGDGKSVQVQNDYNQDTRRLASTQVYREIAPAVVSSKNYKYDDAGDITRTQEQSAVAGAETQCWRLDYLQRLTDAWTPKSGDCAADPSVDGLGDAASAPAPYWTSWTLDAAGDRTRQVEHRTEVGLRTTDYAYPAATAAQPHAVTGTTTTGSAGTTATAQYQYDEAGNTTQRPSGQNGQQTLVWDVEGRLASATDTSGTTNYVYDADGSRLISKDPTGKTLYLPGQELRVDNAGALQSCTRYYSYGGKTIAQRTSTGLTWLISDSQNTASISVDAVTQQAAVRHLTAYGESRDGQSTWPNDKGFLGKTLDKSGLTHVDAREYDASMGRFVSVDPLMDVSDPQQMQGYSYANNSPVSFSDPDGRMIVSDGFYTSPSPGGSSGGGRSDGGHPGGGGYSGGSQGAVSAGHDSGDHQQDKCSHSWWCKTKKWGSKHKATVAGFVAGAVVMVGCESVTFWSGPVSVVACGAAAGAVGSIAHDMVEGGHSIPQMAGNAVFAGVIGGATAGLFSVGGAALSSGVRTLISGAGGQAARQAAGGAARTEAKNLAISLAKPFRRGCLHSFAAGTLVLMADGSTKPIGLVRDGDEVLSTDPQSGISGAERVVDLHRNHDTELTDLTVTTPDGKRSTLHTTQHHPFWSESRGGWTDAADLIPGEILHTTDGTTVTVSRVKSYTAPRTMRDLTINHVHTYYVLAGNTSVLVHNCGGFGMGKGDYDPATWKPAVTHEDGATAIGNDPNTAAALQFAPRVPGVHNVVIHGNANGFANGTAAREVAEAVRANPSYREGTPICLITCHGSNMSYPMFQEMRADVSGYTTTLYVNPDGSFGGGGQWQGYKMENDAWLLD